MKPRAIVPREDMSFYQFVQNLKATTGQDFPYEFAKHIYDTNPAFVDQTDAVATLLNSADMVKVVGDNIANQMRAKYKVLLDQYSSR